MARKIYGNTPQAEREAKKLQLARVLSVSERTVREWLGRIDKDSKEARDRRIFEMWMACYTQEQIAEREDLGQPQVQEITKNIGNGKLAKTDISFADHATDFKPPIYNIWKKQERSEQSNHPANTEVRWLNNLLYLYTKPFDMVVDPFAGGGSTIEICKKRFRRTESGNSDKPNFFESDTGQEHKPLATKRSSKSRFAKLRQSDQPRPTGYPIALAPHKR